METCKILVQHLQKTHEFSESYQLILFLNENGRIPLSCLLSTYILLSTCRNVRNADKSSIGKTFSSDTFRNMFQNRMFLKNIFMNVILVLRSFDTKMPCEPIFRITRIQSRMRRYVGVLYVMRFF